MTTLYPMVVKYMNNDELMRSLLGHVINFKQSCGYADQERCDPDGCTTYRMIDDTKLFSVRSASLVILWLEYHSLLLTSWR